MKFINQLLKSKESIGCDIGARATKFVHLARNGKGLILKAAGIIEADILSGNEVAVQRVKAYFKDNGIAGHRINVNIEDETLRIRLMDLPVMPHNDMKIAIRWNFREYVDGPIDKYTVNFSELNAVKSEGYKRPIVAYGVSSESVDKIVNLVKQVGLRTSIVEPNATALLAVYDLNSEWIAGKYHIILDLGGSVANFVVLGNGELMFSRPLAGGGVKSLVNNISKALSISEQQAESLFKQHTLSKTDDAVQERISVFLSQIVVEIQRSIDAFCLMFHSDKVESIHLCGGGSLITGICEFLTKNLGVETNKLNAFENIDISGVGREIANPELYALAVGLAIPRG